MIEHQSPSQRRLLLTGAGALGVLLGLVLLVTVFGAGGDGRPVALRPGSTSAVGPCPSVAESPPVEDGTGPLPEVGRDPFRQLVTVPELPPTSGGPAPAPTPPTTVPLPAAAPAATTEAPPTTQAPARAEPAVAPEGARGPAAEAPPGIRYAEFELRSIFLDAAGIRRADLTVDGQPFQPAQDEVFWFGFRVERLDDRCITVAARERLELCLPSS